MAQNRLTSFIPAFTMQSCDATQSNGQRRIVQTTLTCMQTCYLAACVYILHLALGGQKLKVGDFGGWSDIIYTLCI